MVVFAAAVEAGTATASAMTAKASGRRDFMERELLGRDWVGATIAPPARQLVKRAYPSGEDPSPHSRLRAEPVADAEMRVDEGPLGRGGIQLLAHLADEDVDRAVAVGHRRVPDLAVDVRSLDDAVGARRQRQEYLELPHGQ